MTTWKQLHPTLQLVILAPWLMIAPLLLAVAPANVRPLHVSNADNTPDTDVSFASSHWLGDPASGKAIAPASVTTPTIHSPAGVLAIPNTLSATDPASNDLTIQGGAGNMELLVSGTSGLLALGAGRVNLGNAMILGWNTNSDGRGMAGPQIRMTDASSLHLYGTGGSSDGSLSLGNLTASGYLSFDGGAGYSDGAGDLTLYGNLTASNIDGNVDFAQNASYSGNSFGIFFHGFVGNTNIDGSGNLLGLNSFSSDNGQVSTDGYGNLSAASLSVSNLTASGYLSFDGGAGYSDGGGDLTALSFSTPGGGTYVSDGGVYCHNILYLDGFAGYLHTGTQSYQAGTFTPTGYLVLKDGQGVAYKIPAAAQ